MKVLILEDSDKKYEDIKKTLLDEIPDCIVERSEDFVTFCRLSNSKEYDLVVTDLLVPTRKNAEVIDITEDVIQAIRDIECINFSTPVIAITSYNDVAEQNYEKFNRLDINIVNYNEDNSLWKDAFLLKARNSIPPDTYDFVIFCALEKEAEAYNHIGCEIGPSFCVNGMDCRKISIGTQNGIVVVAPRMGLVNAAITCTRAIDTFNPGLICMSGICAGISGKSKIYDVIISEMCHQHDSGKWTQDGFIPTPYSVQLHPSTQMAIRQAIGEPSFIGTIKDGLVLTKSEYPSDSEALEFSIMISPTSSGSSVIASESVLESIREQHLKQTSFEMESYALYESARQAINSKIRYFSAKSVVDNGNEMKSDHYHRVACLISAKTVYNLISRDI